MAWFWRRKEPGEGAAEEGVIPEGLWIKCESCKEIVYRAEVDRAGRVCPKCRYPFRISARERITSLLDEGSFEEREAGLRSRDPLHFKDTKKYTERAEERPKQDRPRGGRHHGPRAHRGASGVDRGVRVRVHGRQHGLGGGREAHARDRARHRQARAPADRVGLGRRADAGGDPLAHADGQDLGGAAAPGPGAAAVSVPADRSDHGRRDGELRHARRRHHGGAASPHRLRRAARHRGDDSAGAARGLPALRVPARARPGRPRRRAPRAARDPPPPPRLLRCLRRARPSHDVPGGSGPAHRPAGRGDGRA